MTTEAPTEMARAAERWHWRLSTVFDHTLSERKPVVMSTSLAHPFQRPEKDLQFGFELQPGW